MLEGHQRRDVILEAESRFTGGMRQEGVVRVVQPAGGTYTLRCDEGPDMGGEDSAPPPLAFFLGGVVFCLMTKVPQYGNVLRVPIDAVRVRARWGMHTEGSAIAGTLQTDPLGLDVTVEVDSPASADDVRRVVDTARRACHALQAMMQPVPTRVTLRTGAVAVELDA
jgi:uncharacterized OsmC-like protein